MAVVLRLGRLPAGHVSFAYSPAQEALHSLHVLDDSRHHPLHIPWVLQTRKRLSPALKAELEAFRFLFAGPLPVLWDVWGAPDVQSFAEEMAGLRARPLPWFADHVLGAALGGNVPAEVVADRAQACTAAAARWPGCAALLMQLETDPGQVRERFARMLEGYWESCLAHDWPAIEERFASDIAHRGRLILRRGVAHALAGISPDVTVDLAGNTCLVRRPLSREVELTEHDYLHLTPSYFAWPHLFFHPVPPHLLMAYPVVEQQQEGRAPVPPERLLKLLKAAGDMTRLQILQLVGGRPRSTGELAGLIGISEASVSRHLKQLQEAGLVAAGRQSYYVFYRAVREPVSDLVRGLDAVLSGETDE